MTLDLIQGLTLMLGILVVALTVLVLYLIVLIGKLEVLMHRMRRSVYPPDIIRDGNGRPLRERV